MIHNGFCYKTQLSYRNTEKLFTVILCGPNFAVSQCFQPKIIRYFLLSLKSPQFEFKAQMSSVNDIINILNVWARKQSR